MRKRWGWMLTILKGKHFKVKLLYFKEGGKISMQRHKYRSELWLFVFGLGTMDTQCGNKTVPLEIRKGRCLEIPSNNWHKFTAEIQTLVLEIQYGLKCSERDIERA